MRRPTVATATAVVLLTVYALTLAPDVTFWDAGEFIAAAHSLGIPHPPGTPLFVMLLHAWASLLPIKYAVATNLFSAAATAVAGGVTAHLVWRATTSGAMAIAAGIAAGCMSSVWLNATETEVYAASLALGVLTLWAGERAGRDDGERWTLLTAYLVALAVPLHLSALVATPAAIVLASWRPDGMRVRRALVLGGAFVFAMGAGRVTPWMCVAGAVIMLSSLALRRSTASEHRLPFAALALGVLAISALVFLIMRAQFDPAINQGNPATLNALADVVARRQYAVASVWPRAAPLWLQLANFGQYADWQTALSFGPTVVPTLGRTLLTLPFLGLGYLGSMEHWRADRRSWLGVLTLFIGGSLGVIAYLNLHAGPSIGYGYFADGMLREARERDYFFVFAFWAWGIWAGIGAIALVRRLGRPDWSGVLVAAVPMVLNWSAVTRHREPERTLPRLVAESFLESAPDSAVLFVVGDNDSYPLWYAQRVLRIRRDVSVITLPLLPTRWYRDEIARRYGLLDLEGVNRYDGSLAVAARIADGARRRGRPVAAAISVDSTERRRLGRNWIGGSFAWVECGATCADSAGISASPTSEARIDPRAATAWAARMEARIPRAEVRPAIDPINAYFRRVLECPRQFADAASSGDFSRLDSVCNYR